MIDGLKLRVTHTELQSHCNARANYHRARAEEKQYQLPKLREALEVLQANHDPQALDTMNKVSVAYNLDPNDAVESLERDIRDHRNKALVFEFFADHLFEEDYTLAEGDLRRLEITR